MCTRARAADAFHTHQNFGPSLDNNEWHFIFSFFVHHRNTLNFWIQTIFGDVYLSDSVGLIMIITMRWELYTQQLHLHIYRMHAQKNAFSSVFFLFSFSNDKWRRKRITSSKSKLTSLLQLLNLNISLKKMFCLGKIRMQKMKWWARLALSFETQNRKVRFLWGILFTSKWFLRRDKTEIKGTFQPNSIHYVCVGCCTCSLTRANLKTNQKNLANKSHI